MAIDGIATPGKIIAVHLNYPSRAAQRGRTPAAPSYFFKPASSLAATGGTLERPAGTELLAFEGESRVVWFEGNYQDYEADRKRRLGADAEQPHRIKYRKLVS